MTDLFEESMKSLISLSRKVLNRDVESDLLSTKKEKKKKSNPLKWLENFEVDYLTSETQENKDDVRHTYKQYRSAILRGWRNDIWMRNTPVAIYAVATNPDEKRKIPLNLVYQSACKHRDESKNKLKGLPVEVYSQHEELLDPTYFMLYFYRVIYEIADQVDDLDIIDKYIKELESELKIEPKSNQVTSSQSADTNFEGNIVGFAKDLIGKMGLPVENVNLPQNVDIMGLANNLFNNPETKDFLNDMMGSLNGTQGLEEGFGKIFQKIQQPESSTRLKRIAEGMGIEIKEVD